MMITAKNRLYKWQRVNHTITTNMVSATSYMEWESTIDTKRRAIIIVLVLVLLAP